jgi:hypothetical protein
MAGFTVSAIAGQRHFNLSPGKSPYDQQGKQEFG